MLPITYKHMYDYFNDYNNNNDKYMKLNLMQMSTLHALLA